MADRGLTQFGAADLQGFTTPKDRAGAGFPRALAFLVPMSPRVMGEIKNGPTQAYADEYDRVNRRIDEAAAALAAELARRGFRTLPLVASERTDPVNIRGDFPHKTRPPGPGWAGSAGIASWSPSGSGPGCAWARSLPTWSCPVGPGNAPFLRPLPPLRGGLPDRGLKRRRLGAGPVPGDHPRCRGLRPL